MFQVVTQGFKNHALLWYGMGSSHCTSQHASGSLWLYLPVNKNENNPWFPVFRDSCRASSHSQTILLQCSNLSPGPSTVTRLGWSELRLLPFLRRLSRTWIRKFDLHTLSTLHFALKVVGAHRAMTVTRSGVTLLIGRTFPSLIVSLHKGDGRRSRPTPWTAHGPWSRSTFRHCPGQWAALQRVCDTGHDNYPHHGLMKFSIVTLVTVNQILYMVLRTSTFKFTKYTAIHVWLRHLSLKLNICKYITVFLKYPGQIWKKTTITLHVLSLMLKWPN